MRKFLISLLLAGALMPAAASAQNGGFHGQPGEKERDASSSDRPQRPRHSQRAERSGDNGSAARNERIERPSPTQRNVEPVQSVEPIRQPRHVERDQSVQPVDHVRRVDHDRSSQPMQRVVRIDGGNSTQPVVRVRRPDDGNDGFAGNIREVGHETAEQQPGQVAVHRDSDRTDSHHRWNSDWRRDHRYDWRSYRNRYGSLYRFGRYYDPYGWGYRRFSIGFNLWPSYYGSNFWLSDPWQYRLPPAYGPYRWVRYYDDALLVNIYTGQVVDVINNFFW